MKVRQPKQPPSNEKMAIPDFAPNGGQFHSRVGKKSKSVK